MLRLGIVGARQHRQGIGPHVAGHLARLGACVAAVVGTTERTLDDAIQNLRQRHRIAARGYLALDAMLAAENLDAVVICSPAETHLAYLKTALAAGLPVLCEKPLVFSPGTDWLADGQAIVQGFAEAGKLLMVNQQWPYTLAAFSALYPDSTGPKRPPGRLDVLLSPASSGLAMIPDALPHVLSLLLALAPSGGEAQEVRLQPLGTDVHEANELAASFRYVHSAGATAVRALFRRAEDQPRPAAYAIDGLAVRRVVEFPAYNMFLETTGSAFADERQNAAGHPPPPRRLPLPDPLRALLADFLSRLKNHAAPHAPDPTLLDGLRLLHAVYETARRHAENSDSNPTRKRGRPAAQTLPAADAARHSPPSMTRRR
ncbi:MAG: Gfo/Idh/MocA family oxidoreductase [Planctomycetia bacterium]|nr:Gfo/Idh/MocA family oxidoreductase [Planctomycetia bacterium]